MNWNGQRPYLDHCIAKRANPNAAAQLQADLNKRRRSRVDDSLTTKPVFLPLQFSMTAAGRTSPYNATTKALGYDVIITGVKADVQTRDVILRRTEDEKPLVYVGDETDLFLRTDDFSGINATTGGGQTGVFYFPSPILLQRNNRITASMFKTDTTADAEVSNIVFIGVRVFSGSYKAEAIDNDERALIEQRLEMMEIPRVVFLKVPVEFDSAIAGGLAENIFTPQVPESLLVRGVRTTLRQSLIELGVSGEPNWTVEPTPVWAVAGEDELVNDNYQWFSKPIFLHSGNTIEISRVTNSIDGVNIDAQTGNTITFICETV